MRYFAELSYRGTSYNGWQKQNNAPSVQETIENALSKLMRQSTPVVGAGRTDTGVHASFYILHFDTAEPVADLNDFIYHLNCMLPRDIAFRKIKQVPDLAHARFDAVMREYTYIIGKQKDPFGDGLAWHCPYNLNVEKMNLAASHLIGHHEFTTFCKLHSANKTDLCKVSHACWEETPHLYKFTIRSDRFLRNMVRSLTSLLADAGRGKIEPAEVADILHTKDKGRATGSAPACGLYLSDIIYPEEIYNK